MTYCSSLINTQLVD